MLKYRRDLKVKARALRARMTDAEQLLWSRLRRKQVLGIQFYRQKPIGKYIVDFHAPVARLVIEVDGSQHLAGAQVVRDRERDLFLEVNGLSVLRFDNRQVMTGTVAVMRVIHETVEAALQSGTSPLVPPLFDVQDAQAPRAHGCADAPKGGMSRPIAASDPDDSVPPFEKGGAGGI